MWLVYIESNNLISTLVLTISIEGMKKTIEKNYTEGLLDFQAWKAGNVLKKAGKNTSKSRTKSERDVVLTILIINYQGRLCYYIKGFFIITGVYWLQPLFGEDHTFIVSETVGGKCTENSKCRTAEKCKQELKDGNYSE